MLLLAAGLALTSRGATAVALGSAPAVSAADQEVARETAAVRAEADQLAATHRADPAVLRSAAQAQLMVARNDGTVADFLMLPAAGRLTDALERYGAMLAATDLRTLALGAAGVHHYAARLHTALLHSGWPQLITVSIHDQRLVAYDRGHVIVDVPVTTGRPVLPTDIGAMHVLRKDAPWTMHSPWPKGSPEWYPDTVVQMVVWFTQNGEGLHDASWQPAATLGPGSQYGPFASHGCIHLTLEAVRTLFDWAPIGTPVVVYPGDGSPVASQALQQSVDGMGNPVSGIRGA
jgi:lipoprotein-anchoring transpeptidase ErfK/SrfK